MNQLEVYINALALNCYQLSRILPVEVVSFLVKEQVIPVQSVMSMNSKKTIYVPCCILLGIRLGP